jgi:hypothetical protein
MTAASLLAIVPCAAIAGRQIVLSVVAALPLIVTLVSELESEVRCALIDDAGGPPSARCSTTQRGRDGREG